MKSSVYPKVWIEKRLIFGFPIILVAPKASLWFENCKSESGQAEATSIFSVQLLEYSQCCALIGVDSETDVTPLIVASQERIPTGPPIGYREINQLNERASDARRTKNSK
jgi:hypothetical protein